jgi:hypothetical protein
MSLLLRIFCIFFDFDLVNIEAHFLYMKNIKIFVCLTHFIDEFLWDLLLNGDIH